jgi:hypothetical protein
MYAQDPPAMLIARSVWRPGVRPWRWSALAGLGLIVRWQVGRRFLDEMRRFFVAFVEQVPRGRHLIPTGLQPGVQSNGGAGETGGQVQCPGRDSNPDDPRVRRF